FPTADVWQALALAWMVAASASLLFALVPRPLRTVVPLVAYAGFALLITQLPAEATANPVEAGSLPVVALVATGAIMVLIAPGKSYLDYGRANSGCAAIGRFQAVRRIDDLELGAAALVVDRQRRNLGAIVQPHHRNALGRAADDRDLIDRDSDDDARCRNQHRIRVVLDDRGPGDLGAARQLHGDHALPATALAAVLVERRALAQALRGDGQQRGIRSVGRHDLGGDDVVVLVHADTDDASGRTAHRAHIVLGEADGLGLARHQDDIAVALRPAHPGQLIVVIQRDSDQAGRAHGRELVDRGALDAPLAGAEEQVAALVEAADRHQRADRLIGLQRDQIDDRHALGGAPGVRQLVHLELVDPAARREEEQRVVCAGRDQVLDVVFLGHLEPGNAAAAAMLRAVGVMRQALDIAALGQGDHDVDLGDQVLVGQVADGLDDARAAHVTVLVAQLDEIFLDDVEDQLLAGQ